MITFVVHLKVRPENGPAFEALVSRVRDLSLEREPGVAYYGFAKSVEDGDTYVIIEVYRDAAAHAAHMETDWVRESLPQSHRLVEGGFDIRQYVSPGVQPAVRRHRER